MANTFNNLSEVIACLEGDLPDRDKVYMVLWGLKGSMVHGLDLRYKPLVLVSDVWESIYKKVPSTPKNWRG